MLSKPLFKQSCKANMGLWSFVTGITCVILAVLILVIGNLSVGTVSSSMIDIFLSNSIEASVKRQATTYYDMTETALTNFDENTTSLDYLLNTALTDQQKSQVISTYNMLIASGKTDEEARALMLSRLSEEQALALGTLLDYYLSMKAEDGTIDYSQNAINEYILRIIEEEIYQQLEAETGVEAATYARQFIHQAVSDFVASNSDNPGEFATYYIPTVLEEIFYSQSFENDGEKVAVADYFTKEDINSTALSAILSFQAELTYKTSQLRQQILSEHPEYSQQQIEEIIAAEMVSFKATLVTKISKSLLDDLSDEASTSLKELGQMDMGELVIGSMFFKMAGILIPIVYIIMASNNLISAQVDSGSMAYVLSTPTKRNTVSITQMAYLVLSLFAMFACTTVVGMICLAIAGSSITITYGQLALLNLGAFITMFAISGICFLTSSWFNRSKLSMSIGGGLSMFFFVATILGLFGSTSIPNMMRVDAMNFFNYLSIISLFDCLSILEGSLTFLWKLAILLGIGIVAYIISIVKFKKKDLPL